MQKQYEAVLTDIHRQQSCIQRTIGQRSLTIHLHHVAREILTKPLDGMPGTCRATGAEELTASELTAIIEKEQQKMEMYQGLTAKRTVRQEERSAQVEAQIQQVASL